MCKHSLAVIGFQFFLPFALKNICHAKNKSGCWMPCCICIFRFLVCKSVFSLLLPSLCSCLVSDSCFRNLAEDRSGVNLKDLVHDPSLWVSLTLNHWTADPALHQAAGHWVLGHREKIKKTTTIFKGQHVLIIYMLIFSQSFSVLMIWISSASGLTEESSF